MDEDTKFDANQTKINESDWETQRIIENGEDSDVLQEEEFFFEQILLDDACTVIKVTNKTRERMGKPLKKALIIKLLERGIGFKILESKLHQLGVIKAFLLLWIWRKFFCLVKFSNRC